MAIEEQIQRLAIAIERQGDAAAVREIIRQRDEALEKYRSAASSRDMYERWSDDKNAKIGHLNRRIASLKGALTRAKKGRA